MQLHELYPFDEERKNRKRLGRGSASGWGCTSGKGNKGQNCRAGGGVQPWFEGGQMPLQRRIPKFGFKNRFRTEFSPLNVQTVADFIEAGKLKEEISFSDLVASGLIDNKSRVKLLGDGEIDANVSIEVHACSKSAKEKVEKAGGSVTIISN